MSYALPLYWNATASGASLALASSAACTSAQLSLTRASRRIQYTTGAAPCAAGAPLLRGAHCLQRRASQRSGAGAEEPAGRARLAVGPAAPSTAAAALRDTIGAARV